MGSILTASLSVLIAIETAWAGIREETAGGSRGGAPASLIRILSILLMKPERMAQKSSFVSGLPIAIRYLSLVSPRPTRPDR